MERDTGFEPGRASEQKVDNIITKVAPNSSQSSTLRLSAELELIIKGLLPKRFFPALEGRGLRGG